MNKKIFLTVAGSDPSGGAGIQADIRVAEKLGLYPTSVVTAITVQNGLVVNDIKEVNAKLIQAQFEAVVEDLKPDAIKVGLLCTPETVRLIAKSIKKYNLSNIVVDPILSLTLRREEPSHQMIRAYADYLFELATLVTPNLQEYDCFERELGVPFSSICQDYLLKGGHSRDNEICEDIYFHSPDALPGLSGLNSHGLLVLGNTSPFPTMHDSMKLLSHELESETFNESLDSYSFKHKRIHTQNTHGSGCILSSAIACNLAMGNDIMTSIQKGIDFTDREISNSKSLKIGKGNYGPAMI